MKYSTVVALVGFLVASVSKVETQPTTSSTVLVRATTPVTTPKINPKLTYITISEADEDEWYMPIYSLFDSATTFYDAQTQCKKPAVFSTRMIKNQSLPDFLMFDDLINLAVTKNPSVYSGKLLWTNIYTSSLSNSDSAMVYGMAQNGTDNQLKMTNFPQLFCPPYNTFTTDAHWMKYKARYAKIKPTKIRFVKDFTYPKRLPNSTWFPGCWKEYNRGLNLTDDMGALLQEDPLQLPFVCQTFIFTDSQDMKLTGKTQKLPYHLNALMPPSSIGNYLQYMMLHNPSTLPDSAIPLDEEEGLISPV